MSDEGTFDDVYFSESTVVPTLLKPKDKGGIKPPLDFEIEVERYNKTKVRRKTLRYVPKQD